MGGMFEFTCPGCGYDATACGGREVGFVAVLQTMTCDTCRELVDVLIGREGRDGPTGDPEYDADIGLCPECSGDNVAIWPPTMPCPKCDGHMERSESGGVLWD